MTRFTSAPRVSLVLFLSACVLLLSHACTWAGTTERVSVSGMGAQANGLSVSPVISADGRFVVFESAASDLTPGDTNDVADVFLRDRVTGRTVRVSIGPEGQPGDDRSSWPAISADGRFVAFESVATNFGPGDAFYSWDIFVYEVSTGQTEIVSLNELGVLGSGHSWKPTISGDGRFVAFISDSASLVPDDTNGHSDVFVYDRETQQMELVSTSSGGAQGNADSGHDWARAAISADGRFVAFVSDASNLVSGDTNGVRDVFLHDRETGVTRRASVSSAGVQGNGPCGIGGFTHGDVAINADGRHVAFVSHASDLVPGDTNGVADVFVHDRVTGSTERVSVSSSGEETDLEAYDVSISGDGRLVVFASHASNLVSANATGSKQIYLHDRDTHTTHLVTAGATDQPSLYDSMHPGVTPDGHFVCMASQASDLVPSDTNGTWDILVYDRLHTLPFSDIACLYWACEEIEACVGAGIVSGYPDGLYRPKWNVARDQMAIFVSRALSGGDAYVPDGPATATFVDMPDTNICYKYVEFAVDNGIVFGYPDGLYHPELDVDRGQMAIFIARAIATPVGEAGLADYIPPTTPTFADVTFADTDPYRVVYKYVEYLHEHGVVHGYPDGLYHPEVGCTRDQMAAFVSRAFELPT